MRSLVLLLMIVSTVAGCGMRRVENVQTPYVYGEYLPYNQPGTARIAGEVAKWGLAGSAMTCAGMDVVLMPATPLTREAAAIIHSGKVPSTRALKDDPLLLRSTMKKAECGDKGEFMFDGLAAGTWILFVELRKVDGGWRTGTLIREVTVSAGEHATVAFMDQDFAQG